MVSLTPKTLSREVLRALDAAFPFHAVVDGDNLVLSAGWLLRRASPDVVGKPLPLAVAGLALEGPLIPVAAGSFVFLGAPVLRDAAELEGTLASLADRWADDRLAQKLEAVGQLAAGIAHEINTPVQYVSDSVHFLRNAAQEVRALLARYRAIAPSVLAAEEAAADLSYLDEQVPRAFDRVLDGTNRVAAIVRAMKDFARPDQREMAPADLNQALRSTLTVCRSEYRYLAEVATELGDLPAVFCHVGELNQVFLNLIINAAHAIADAGRSAESGGQIRIATGVDGDHVVIAIADTGCGITADAAARVFDPFFTTKEVGRGTGQGLAISRSIVVDKHQGTLGFTSEPGQGTTFRVRLPIGPVR